MQLKPVIFIRNEMLFFRPTGLLELQLVLQRDLPADTLARAVALGLSIEIDYHGDDEPD